MPKLCLHGVFLIPHLAVNADVPVLVHHDVVIALVQHTKALQAGSLSGHPAQPLTDTAHPALQMYVAVFMTESGSGAIST